MKRWIAMTLILMLVLFTASCDGGTTDDPKGETGGDEATTGGEDASSSDDATTEGRYDDEEPALWDGSVAEGFEGGTGSESDPYLISSGAQLAFLAKTVNDGSTAGYAGKYFKLTCNIDLGGIEWDPIGCYHRGPYNLRDRWFAFGGFFDGDGHVVSNLKVTTLEKYYYNHAGLFGYADEDTEIKDLWVKDAEIDVTTTASRYLYVGGLIGASEGSVSGCYVSGSVRGYNDYQSKTETSGVDVGGLAGAVSVSRSGGIWDCGSSATVYSKGATSAYAGGLLSSLNGSASSCYATGSVEVIASQKRIDTLAYTANGMGGGLIATATGGSVTDSYATGDVRVSSEYEASSVAGGLIGKSTLEAVVGCYADGSVAVEHYGNACCGGLIGSAPLYSTGEIGSSPQAAEIRDCYASGDVNAVTESKNPLNPSISRAGGLIGSLESFVIRCYAEGDVSALGDGYQSAAGGLVAEMLYSEARLENSYALGSVESDDYAGGLVGKTEGDVTVIYCYAVGDVSAGDEGGALVGHDGSYNDNSTRFFACFAVGDVDAGTRGGSVIPGGFGSYEALYYLEDQTLTLGGEIVTERNEYEPGEACTAVQLSDEAFYTGMLGWSADVWNLTGLDAADGKLPTLRLVE